MRNPTEIVIENGDTHPRYLPLDIEHDRKRTKRKLIPKLLRVAGRIPFADDLAAAYYAAMDPHTPRKAKAVLFAALGYFVVPTDMLPDMIAGLGFTDDATVLATALSIVGSQVRDRHRRAARKLLGLPEPVEPDDPADATAA